MEEKKENTYLMEVGYKGLDEEMRPIKGDKSSPPFKIGGVYYKDNIDHPKLCSDQGYHFCKTLKQVFTHYPNDGKNRYFKIHTLGNTTHSSDKSITTAFRLVEEVDVKAVMAEEERAEKLAKEKKDIESLGKKFNLDSLRFLQTKYPHIHVGGSTGLFLHGLWLQRWNNGTGDLDLVTPFYTFFEGDVEKQEADREYEISHIDGKASGNDFDQTFLLNGDRVDVKIDPQQSYDIITVDGFRYKVSKVETILEAKLRYAMNGQIKHRRDIFEMVGKLQDTHNQAGLPITMRELYDNKKRHEQIRTKPTTATPRSVGDLAF